MKYIYKLASVILMVISFVGCYKDKGNYDLRDIKPVIIGLDKSVKTNVILGDSINIYPIITYEDSTLINDDDYTFKWTLDLEDKEGWNNKNLKWKPDILMDNKNLTIHVLDKKTGVTYVRNISCRVATVYDHPGYLVLSEKDGKSELGYLTLTFDYTSVPGYAIIKEAVPHTGVYKKTNGEDLGTGPIRLHEHHLRGGSVKGQQLILQKSNGVDVVGTSFEKVFNLEETFLGGSLPQGVTMENAMFMYYVNILSDNNGSLYTRIKSTDKLFHSNYFLTTPISYQGEVLTDCRPIYSVYQHQKFALIHDNKNKRLLGILDGGTVDENKPSIDAGKVIDIPAMPSEGEPVAPKGFVPLNDLSGYEVEHIGFYRDPDDYYRNGFVMVLEKGGEYFVQKFSIDRADGNILTLVNCSFDKMNMSGVSGTPTKYYTLSYVVNSNDLLVVFGNKLYIYDTMNPSDPLHLYYTFTGNVNCMNNDEYGSRQIGVGLDNGQLVVVNVQKPINVPDEYKIIYETPIGTFGNIVDAKMRIGTY